MDTREFLERVLPLEGGDYFGASIGPNNKYAQTKLESLDALSAYIEGKKQQHHNVFFATGTYTEQRLAKDTQFKKALYVDIDTGIDKPYSTKKQAVGEVARFIKESKFLKPSIIVDSGNGVHVYWTLDKPVALDTWVALANALESMCEQHHLLVDSKVTTDAARILRVPGTVNYKNTDDPRRSTVLMSTTTEYPVATVSQSLIGTTSTALELLKGTVSDDLDMDTTYGDEPRFAAHMIEKCGVLGDTNLTGGEGQDEPFWMFQLQLLAFCEDGHDYLHTMSDGHASYDFNRTEKKFAIQKQKVIEKKVGPILCKTLGKSAPDKCRTCQWNGHISTPLQLGKVASDVPYGWKQDDKSVYRRMHSTDKGTGEDTSEWIRVLNLTIHDFSMYRSTGSAGIDTVCEYTLKINNTESQLSMPVTDSFIRNTESELQTKYGVALSNPEARQFKDLIVAFQQEMSRARNVRLLSSSLGWQDIGGERTFVLPSGAAKPNSTTVPVVFRDANMGKTYTPRGERQKWIEVAHALTAQDRHANNSAILAAFAAPLVRFTDVNSCLLSVYSQGSGTGKSTAIITGQAVWGHPVQGVNSLQDTPNSVIHKLGYINNLPAYWDEVRLGKDPRNFLNMIFQLSQGKERSRLNVDIKQRETGTWRTMLCVATNSSIRDHADLIDAGTTASKLRIFEVEADKVTDDVKLDIQPMALHDNYGHIGVEYASWIAANQPAVSATVSKCRDMLKSKLEAHEDERFWIATASSLLAAAVLSSKLGYTKIDVKGYTLWIMENYKRMRVGVREVDFDKELSAQDYVTEYMSSYAGQFTVTDQLSSLKNKSFGMIHSQPKHGAILGVIGNNDNRARIVKKPFVKWLYESGIDPTVTVRTLIEGGATEAKAQYSGGVQGYTGRMKCLEFDLP